MRTTRVPTDLLMDLLSDKDHDTRIIAERGLLAFLDSQSAERRPAADDDQRLSDIGNELHNLSCHVVHSHEGWAQQLGALASELWRWPDHPGTAPASAAPAPIIGIDLAEGAIKGAWRDALIAQGWTPPATEPKRLIGWRTENFLWETADIAVAQNWEPNIGVLPIFEGDPNTALVGQVAQAADLRFVFTGMPGPGSECVFVEIENERGESISAGQWHARPDGLCELALTAATARR